MNSRMASGVGKLARLQFQRRPSQFSHFEHSRYGHSKTLGGLDFSAPLGFRKDDDKDVKRYYHAGIPSERAAALIMGLASVSALAYAGSSAVTSYNEWKAAQPTEEELEKQRKEEEKERLKAEKENEQTQQQQKKQEKKGPEQPRENIFKEWFGVGVGAKYYEGGFEEKMTKREAALILGVRESSSPSRIKDAHRRLLILNHPDTGGSTYISGKLNEAKELLLKGRARV